MLASCGGGGSGAASSDTTPAGDLASDTVPPVITLNGPQSITLLRGEAYIELGATATDNVDGPVAVIITGTVNSDVVGVYTITYSARDTAKNRATTTRTVTVTANGTAQSSRFIPTKLTISQITQYPANQFGVEADLNNILTLTLSDLNTDIYGGTFITQVISNHRLQVDTAIRNISIQLQPTNDPETNLHEPTEYGYITLVDSEHSTILIEVSGRFFTKPLEK